MPDDEAQIQQNQPTPSSPTSTIQFGLTTRHASIPEQAIVAQDCVLENDDDLDFRSPKRRRLSPSDDEDAPDIEAAAARALAMSLGQSLDPPQASATAQTVETNGVKQDHPNQFAGLPSLPRPEIPTRQLRRENLSGLNEVASHVLSFLAELSHLEIGEMLFGPPSARGQEYRALKQRFEEGKRIYLMNGSPFLSPYALDLREGTQIDMIRKINLAVFMASIFSGEIGLRIMDINFIDVFVPEGGRLLKAQGSIYLELKTHAFMAATRTASAMLNQVMIDLFPSDMDKHFLAKRTGSRGLAPSEQDFLKRLASRRDILYSVIRTNKLGTLPDTYRWNDFAREVSVYLTKHMESMTSTGKEITDNPTPPSTTVPVLQGHMESQFSLDAAAQQLPLLPGSLVDMADVNVADNDLSLDSIEAFVAQAARAAALSMGDSMDIGLLPPAPAPLPTTISVDVQSIQTSTPPLPQLPQHNSSDQHTHQTQFQHYNPNGATVGEDTADGFPEIVDGEVPHSSQTAPTQVLYERARQAATNKALLSKKLAPPSHRRPWTTEEENALMTGLDQVKGPHWSQILAMYGPGGTVNESLKDRNQVQLKDKARNLKLFFLKAGIEVPYYLQAVTGDLRTRAPGQAEKKERERLLNEGEKAPGDEAQAGAEAVELEYVETENRDSDELTPNPYQAASEQTEKQDAVFDDQDDPEFDMEAMIAKAAASATQGFRGPPWGIE